MHSLTVKMKEMCNQSIHRHTHTAKMLIMVKIQRETHQRVFSTRKSNDFSLPLSHIQTKELEIGNENDETERKKTMSEFIDCDAQCCVASSRLIKHLDV